ncbi:MAG: hypothetical protein JRG75_10720 [Deltaproteobacteria bacterium]|nr:hypothetical protein [Deltaproteobacteria bacterium]
MLKSIEETKKLFTIEGIQNGQVNIKTSNHLLSLSEEKQIEVLTTHLKNLKKDSAKYESPAFETPNGQSDDIDRMQLQILIQVIEGLLNQI